MKVILAKEHGKDDALLRDIYCQSLIELAAKDSRIVALDADLVNAIGMKPFKEKYPERFIDCGIAEANMIGVACGMSVEGKIPFVHSFGPFISRRACDQIFISGSYNKANVKMVGSDPGIAASSNGGTHMPFEDMAILRSFPNMTLIEPCDCASLKALMPQIAAAEGMVYIRMVRKDVNKIYEEGTEFEIGKAVEISKGSDVTIISSGLCVREAIFAAQALAKEGISAGVLDMHTWKPIDKDAIISAAKETGAIVTAENHNIMGGLGSSVCEVLAKNYPVPVENVGVNDEFGEVGSVDYLRARFHLEAVDIVNACKRAVSRKL